MNEFNIITTYYNNKDLLLKFLEGFKYHKQTYDFLKLYIIDDGSQQHPAESFLVQQKDVHLYKVTEDLGFNSHGCRNLGMTVSDKDWNLLIDSDTDLYPFRFDILANWPTDPDIVMDFSVNTLFLHKRTFFSCNGYDEEFVNQHCGDRVIIEYFKSNYIYESLEPHFIGLKYNRGGRNIIFTNDVDITTYDDENMILYSSTALQLKNAELTEMITTRYKEKTFANKKILNFPWTKVW